MAVPTIYVRLIRYYEEVCWVLLCFEVASHVLLFAVEISSYRNVALMEGT